MNLYVVPPALAEIDQLQHETLVVSHFREDRPLRGLAGLIDWRMNGTLNRYVRQGRTTGEAQEVVMIPGHKRLRYQRILVLGLGARREFTPEQYRLATVFILSRLRMLNATRFTIGLPGLDALRIPARQAASIWLAAFYEAYVQPRVNDLEYDVCLVVPKELHADVRDPLDTFVRQHRKV
ncbi:MAG: hypothetical protein AMXMBFR64_32130 [Myxococcales bacterium]